MKKGNIWALIAALLISLGACTEAKQSEKLNLIFIYADDWGYGDVGIHGSTFCETPNIDKLASEGIDFQSFTVNNPVCSPSRTGIITGQYPARHSVHGHFASVESHMKRNMPDWLDPKAPMLPRMLKEAGYKTGHFGKWHLTNTHVADSPEPFEYGYDEYGAFNLPSKLPQMNPDSTIYRTIDFVKRHQDEAFFINVWLHEPHTPHYPKPEYLAQFAQLDSQQMIYAAVLAEADAKIGQLMSTLKELNIDDNTLVIFSSDNGPEITSNHVIAEDNSTGPGYGSFYSVGETGGLKGRKRSLLSGGIRVPFIARCPSIIPAGRVNKTSQITGVDILPTFVELASAQLPASYKGDGESIVKALKGEDFSREKTIYWDWRYAGTNKPYWPSAAIQKEGWKLLINEKDGRHELYDLNADWAEQKDLYSQQPEKAKEMEEDLKQWLATLPHVADPTCFSKERSTLE